MASSKLEVATGNNNNDNGYAAEAVKIVVNRVIALVHYFMHPEACALTVKIKHAVAS
jgi:hypothetical protein